MTDLIAFLYARLDEDTRDAHRTPGGPWHVEDDEAVVSGHLVVVEGSGLDHIARWDPARVLREVEAKRRILDLHSPGRTGYFVDNNCEHDRQSDPCPTVRLLALPYSDQPDYRPDWRP